MKLRKRLLKENRFIADVTEIISESDLEEDLTSAMAISFPSKLRDTIADVNGLDEQYKVSLVNKDLNRYDIDDFLLVLEDIMCYVCHYTVNDIEDGFEIVIK